MSTIRKTVRAGGINYFDVSGLIDRNGVIPTSTDLTGSVTVKDASGAVVDNARAFTYIGPGHWYVECPASVWVTGAGPWDAYLTLLSVLTGLPAWVEHDQCFDAA